LPCYHLARTFSFERARTRSEMTSKGFLICTSLSPWPMYYQCKWSVQLALIVFFTSKCLCNEVIGSHPIRRGNISFQNNKWNIKENNNILPTRFLFEILLRFVSGIFPIQGPSSMKCVMKCVVVEIGWRFYQAFLDQTHVSFDPSQWFSTHDCCPQRPRCVRHNIHGPWIVDDVDFYSCFILNYTDIISALSRFIGINCLA